MYTIVSFNTTGQAEVIRLLLVLAKVTYNDNRVGPAEWPSIQSLTPWGNLPYLEEDGKILGQVVPILSYLGQTHGLARKDAWEQALAASVCEATNDLLIAMNQVAAMKDDEKKLVAQIKYSDQVRRVAPRFEKFISEHGKNHFTVGDSMTVADICVFDVFNQIHMSRIVEPKIFVTDFGKGSPTQPPITGVYQKVMRNPVIAAYLKTRMYLL